MTASETFEPRQGEWWLPSVPTIRLPGSLKLLPDHRAQVDLFGRFPELPLDAYSVVMGETYSGERISLHGAYPASGMGLRSTSGLSHIVAHQAYIGAWFLTPAEVAFTEVSAEIVGLVDWLRSSDFLTAKWSEDEKSVTVYNYRDHDVYCRAEYGSTVVTAYSKSPWWAGGDARKETYRQVAALRIVTAEHQSIEHHLEVLHHFQSLLWLFFVRPAAIESLWGQCSGAGQQMLSGDVVNLGVQMFVHGITNRRSDEAEVSLPIVGAADVANGFTTLFTRWADMRTSAPAMTQLFFLPLYGTPLYRETRFLNLVQVAEGYSRQRYGDRYMPADTWRDGPFKVLAAAIPASLSHNHRQAIRGRLRYANGLSFRRLLATLVADTPVVRDRLIRCPDAFADDVAACRNYYVHLADDLKKRVSEAPPVEQLCQYLEILLHCRMLADIGVADKHFEDCLSGGYQFGVLHHLREYWSTLRRHYPRTPSDT